MNDTKLSWVGCINLWESYNKSNKEVGKGINIYNLIANILKLETIVFETKL